MNTTSIAFQWPNLFVVGAAKAGTTSLYHYLNQHPEIYMSPVKEPHFFSKISPGDRYCALSGCVRIKTDQAYLSLFQKGGGHPIVGEASPSYLWDQHAPERIYQVSPKAKIIIMLREPVSRAYSHYLNEVRAGLENWPFLEAIRADLNSPVTGWGISPLYVELGRYSTQIKRYLKRFDAVKIIFFEDFVRNTEATLQEIFEFLSVDSFWATRIEPEVMNSYAIAPNALSKYLLGTPWVRQLSRQLFPQPWRAQLKQLVLVKAPKPTIDPQAKALLQDLYQEELTWLPQILGRALPW